MLPIFFSLSLIFIFLFQAPKQNLSKSTVHISLNPDLSSHLILGQHLLAADLMWLRVIQDFDYKESGIVNMGWVYHSLDLVTTLDPRFYMPYIMGATVLSVLIHDKEGARRLYEKAIKKFPTDWALSYRAAYHYLYEIHDCLRSAELLVAASQIGAPSWVSDLAAKLYTKTAQFELARSVLVDAQQRAKGTSSEILFTNRLKDLDRVGPNGNFEGNGAIVHACKTNK